MFQESSGASPQAANFKLILNKNAIMTNNKGIMELIQIEISGKIRS